MVKLSKFFGKENEDEHSKSRKNGPPADPGLPADVRQQPVEPDQKTILPKQESSQQVLSSWVEHKDIEEIYNNAIWVFKRFYSLLASKPDFLEPELLHVVRQCIRNVSHDEKSLIFYINVITLDNYLYSHAVNTAIIAITLGKGLHYSVSALEDVGLSALLHHAGLFGILDLVPQKIELSEKFVEEFKKNTDASRKMVRGIMCSHESLTRFIAGLTSQSIRLNNVQAYPKELPDKQINEYAHIIKLSSLYELLTHAKPDQERLIPHIACKWLIENWQTMHQEDMFAGKLIRTLIETIGLYPVGSYVRLSTDELARIIRVEKQSPVRPQMEVLLSSNGKRMKEKKVIALKDIPLISIKEAIDETKLKIDDKKFLLSLQVRRWWTGNIKT